MIAVEAMLHAVLVSGSVVALSWTPVPAVYVGLVLFGDSIFPALSENFLHNQTGAAAQHRTRTIRGRMFEAYFLELGYHLEHHAYPSVPTRNSAELARRLSPSLAALGVVPLRLI